MKDAKPPAKTMDHITNTQNEESLDMKLQPNYQMTHRKTLHNVKPISNDG